MALSKLKAPLSQYLAQNGSRPELETEIWNTYGHEGAIMVLDMAGFSITTRERGIVYYLAMINKMQCLVEPIIEQNGGEVVKFESDNCFARFPDTQEAITAANTIQAILEEHNKSCPDELDILIACGIDFGRFLLIDGGDFYGDPVNCASKLGEDLAEAGETLVSRRALERLDERTEKEMMRYGVSSLQIEAARQ